MCYAYLTYKLYSFSTNYLRFRICFQTYANFSGEFIMNSNGLLLYRLKYISLANHGWLQTGECHIVQTAHHCTCTLYVYDSFGSESLFQFCLNTFGKALSYDITYIPRQDSLSCLSPLFFPGCLFVTKSSKLRSFLDVTELFYSYSCDTKAVQQISNNIHTIIV